ncbi:hypothetical protein CICLE_v10010660mg, partial [Citrus x clementina]
ALNETGQPVQFSSQQLRIAIDNFSHLFGSGGFLCSLQSFKWEPDKKSQDHFLAELRTIGRTNDINIVKLYGFCFDRDWRAFVYKDNKSIDWDTMHIIAIGTAEGIVSLHDGCQQQIIHYNIKPENILLDVKFWTPGYAAPETWMSFPVTHKCDVRSFGMLLFEILGRRRMRTCQKARSGFPSGFKWVWKKLEKGEFQDLIIVCGMEKNNKEKAERMALVALWRVQYKPEAMPSMTV